MKMRIKFLKTLSAGLFFLSIVSLSEATPIISGLSPNTGSSGAIIELQGTGFTETQIIFSGPAYTYNNSAFQVLSDSEIQVAVPTIGSTGADYQSTITLLTTAGATFTFPSCGDCFGYDYISSGEVANGTIGSSTIFIDSNGTVHTGSGSSTYFLKSGASLNISSGNNTIFYESGATINFGGGGGNVAIEVLNLQPSYLNTMFNYETSTYPTLPDPTSPVPEPATILLLGTGLVGLAGVRRKFRR